jgi:hypothetical protein
LDCGNIKSLPQRREERKGRISSLALRPEIVIDVLRVLGAVAVQVYPLILSVFIRGKESYGY